MQKTNDDMVTVWFIWNDGSHTDGRVSYESPTYFIGTRGPEVYNYRWYDVTYSPFLAEWKAIADLLGGHPEYNHPGDDCWASAEFETPAFAIHNLSRIYI